MTITPAELRILALSAVIAWSIVEIIKPALKLLSIERGDPRRALAVRIAALVMGALTGALLYPALEPKDGPLIGAAFGASAGALNALIVRKIKKRIKGE